MIGKLLINGFLNGHMSGLLSSNMIDLGVMVFSVVWFVALHTILLFELGLMSWGWWLLCSHCCTYYYVLKLVAFGHGLQPKLCEYENNHWNFAPLDFDVTQF